MAILQLQNSQTNNPTNNSSKISVVHIILILIIIAAVVIFFIQHSDKLFADNRTIEPKAQIIITQDGFAPGTIKVKPHTAVTWLNKDATPHQIATDDQNSPLNRADTIESGDSYSFSFDQEGTVNYYDYLNPDIPPGTILIQK
jgi:plastocyanin